MYAATNLEAAGVMVESRFQQEMNELNRSKQAPADTAEALREQIRQHEFADQHRGLLDRATTNVLNRGDESSLSSLKALEQRAAQGNLQAGEISSAIQADRDAMKWQGEVSMYGTGFMKAATLFLPGKGKIPWMAAGAVHSVDQIKVAPDISGTQMIADGLLGFGKGAGLKITMDKVGATSWRTWEKGLVIGGAGGAMETSLHRENWVTAQGSPDILGGLGRTTKSAFLGAGTGAVTFHVGHKVFQGISTKFTNGALEKSPLASNMGVGFSFGVTGGFTGEALNQIQRQEFDPVQLAVRSLMQGGVDMFAGGAGYKAGQLYMPKEAIGTHPVFNESQQGPTLVEQAKTWGTGVKTWGENFLKPKEPQSDSTFAGKSRKFDKKDGEGGKEERFNSFEALAEHQRRQAEREQQEQGGEQGQQDKGGWGNSEQVVEPVSKPKTENRGADETEPVVERTVTESRTPDMERTDSRPVRTSTELDTAQTALQARLDALALEGRLKGLPKDAGKLFKSLDKFLQEANGNQPIPEMEIAVIKDTTRYKQLPDMIAQAVAKAEAARAQETPVESEEIVSGGARKVEPVKEGPDRYAELLRLASEGQELSVPERSELNLLHEGRVSAELDKLTLAERIAETKKELDAQRQPQEEVAQGKEEAREVVEEGLPIDKITMPDGRIITIPDINVAAETNNAFGSTFTAGNRLLTQAVTDAYLAVGAEGKVQSDAIASLRKIATENAALKNALETIASKHPEIDGVIKTALEGVVAPAPGSQQFNLLDIVTRRPNEMAQMVQEGGELAARAAKGDAAAKQQLEELAKRSVDVTDPSKPVFDVHEGMSRLGREKPELNKTIYEAFNENAPNQLLTEFGVRFAKEAAAGNAESGRMLNELAQKHNQPEVRDALFEVGKKEGYWDTLEPLYGAYKPNLTIEQKAFVGVAMMKNVVDAIGAARAELQAASGEGRTADPRYQDAVDALQQRFNTYAKENPEMLYALLQGSTRESAKDPAYEQIFQEAFGLTAGPASDVPVMTAASEYIKNGQLDLGDAALNLRARFAEAVQAREQMGYDRAVAEKEILDNFAKVVRMHGIEEANILKHLVSGSATELGVMKAAGDYAQAKHQELVGQPTEPGLTLDLMSQVGKAVQERVNQGYPKEVAQREVLEKLESVSRLNGLEDVGVFKSIVEMRPGDVDAMSNAAKIFDTLQAAKVAAERGEAIPAPAHPGQFMHGIRQAVEARKMSGESAVDAVLSLKKNLDVLARERGLDNADALINEIVMAATPVNEFTAQYLAEKAKTPEQIEALKEASDTEYNASLLAKEMLYRQMQDRQAIAKGTPRENIPSGEELVRELWKGVYEHMKGGEPPVAYMARMRERLETEAALRGEPDANSMLPFLAEAFTPGHRRPAGPEPAEPLPTTELTQAEIAHRIAEFRQIVSNSKFPGDPSFKASETEPRYESMNRWFEHQLQVRRELFEWMNNNKPLWQYVKDYAATTESSPIAAMIDGYPHMESNFLHDFYGFPKNILTPAQPRTPEVAREATREEVAREEVAREEVAREEVPVEQADVPRDGFGRPLEPQADLNTDYRTALNDMFSADGQVMRNAAENLGYQYSPREGGLRHFQRWLGIMKANAADLTPKWQTLFARPEVELMQDGALFDFFSMNKAQPLNPRNWDASKHDSPVDRAEQLTKAFDAFKPEAKPPARNETAEPPKPPEFDPNHPDVVAGIKLATLLANDRPTLQDVLFKMGERSPYKVQFKELFRAMLENGTSGEQIRNVLQAINEAQNLYRAYNDRVNPRPPRPGQRPREMEPMSEEQIAQMPIQAQQWIAYAQSQARLTNPAKPGEIAELIDGIARQTIEVARPPRGKPGGPQGGPRPGGGGPNRGDLGGHGG